MEKELERIVKSEKSFLGASPRVILFVGVVMFLLGVVVFLHDVVASWSGAPFRSDMWCILAGFLFIGYYEAKQARVNVELVKAIKEIRERLDQGESL